jgi:hypothetical protein
MGLILERSDQVRFYTDMRATLQALGISAAKFDWFISDIETNVGEGFPDEDAWMSGEELQQLLDSQEIQFVWAVFSAVPRGFRCNVKTAPYVEGYPDYWKLAQPKPQLPGALFEIACWDSSATIFVGLPEALSASLMTALPDTEPLVNAHVKRKQ